MDTEMNTEERAGSTGARTVDSPDGTPIAWWCSGTGRPLVLVHGTTADHTRWDSVLHLLEPHARTCAMDRRGRGRSGDTEPYALEREAEDVAVVVDELAAETGGPVDLFGHSHGAICALEGALITPNVRRLVLYEPPVAFEPSTSLENFLDRAAALLAQGRNEEVLEAFFREVVQVPEGDLEALRAAPVWPARVAAAHTIPREERVGSEYRFDPERFASLTAPTLLLVGSESPEFLRRSSELVAGAVPGSRIAFLEGQQHVAMDTAPELVAETVLAFLRAP